MFKGRNKIKGEVGVAQYPPHCKIIPAYIEVPFFISWNWTFAGPQNNGSLYFSAGECEGKRSFFDVGYFAQRRNIKNIFK